MAEEKPHFSRKGNIKSKAPQRKRILLREAAKERRSRENAVLLDARRDFPDSTTGATRDDFLPSGGPDETVSVSLRSISH